MKINYSAGKNCIIAQSVYIGKGGVINDREYSTDELIAGVITFHLYITYIKNIMVNTNNLFMQINTLLNALVLVLIVAAYLYLCRSRILQRFNPKTLLILFSIVVMFFFSFSLNPRLIRLEDFNKYLVFMHIRTYLVYCLPLFCVSSCLKNKDILMDKISKYSHLLFAFSTIGFLFSIHTLKKFGEYSMSYGYALCFFVIVAIIKFKNQHKLMDIIEALVAFMYVVAVGSRGPILCMLVAAVCIYLFDGKFNKKKLIVIMAILLFALICFLNIRLVAQIAYNTLKVMGIESRSLWLIVNDYTTYSPERVKIHNHLIAEINKHPYTGIGILGAEATYVESHGLYLDTMVNFGYILGTVILVLLFINLYTDIKKYNGTKYVDLLMLFAFIEFPKGFFAGGVWGDKELWMILGLLISNKMYLKITKKECSTNNKYFIREKYGVNRII